MKEKEDQLITKPKYISSLTNQGFHVQTTLLTGIALGDCCAGITSFTGLDRLAALYSQVTGKDCGCKQRQAYLNKLAPKIT